MSDNDEKFAGYAVLELMGHRRLGGFVSETTLAGGAFLRIDVPGDEDGQIHSTQFYSPGSVYCLTPCSEEAAKIVARSSRPEPVHQWELSQPKPTRAARDPAYCRDCGLPRDECECNYDDGETDQDDL